MNAGASPFRAGETYHITGSSLTGTSFETKAYCFRVGGGTVDLVGKVGEAALLVKSHPSGDVFPQSVGFSLGDRVDASVHERGSSQHSAYAPYLRKLSK